MRAHLIFSTALLVWGVETSCAADADSRFSWMLPKTVLDGSIVYTLDGCKVEDAKDVPTIKITPTFVARSLPDTYAGRIGIDATGLKSVLEDRNVSIQTFAGSHILNSMGSNPVNQVAQIGGNVLGGLTKVFAIAFGVPSPASAGPPVKEEATPPEKNADCKTLSDDTLNTLKNLKVAKENLKTAQAQLGNDTDATDQKKDNARIQALQTQIADFQSDLTITVKGTVDPGVSGDVITDVSGYSETYHHASPHPIASTGLIGTFNISDKGLKKWFKDPTKINKASIEVNIYLDFREAYVPIAPEANGQYQVKSIGAGFIYRDVAYIPVLVWRGEKGAKVTPGDPEPAQLSTAQAFPFGQFGAGRKLPLNAAAFQNLNWSITFLENGELVNATFSTKSTGVGATNLFSSAASAANAIATEQRNAASPSTQATFIQGQADLIYQNHRLELCQRDPANCPIK